MDYKHVLPIEINYRIRHFIEFISQQTPEVYLESPQRVFFLDAPSYGNIGDQAIAFAMEKFVGETLPEFQQIEITEDKLPSSIKWLKRHINSNDLICLTGGGNMGVMYQRYEAARRLVIKNFPINPIIIFPQTIDYGTSTYGQRELRRARLIYGNAKNITLCARDKRSFNLMQGAFPETKILYCPDIVLYLDYKNVVERSDTVGICLRSDKERVLDQSEENIIKNSFPNHCMISTTTENDVYITSYNRQQCVEQKLKEFGSMRLVVTDRLHGTIFSYITNTPVIALPNNNGKVREVCKYLSKRGNVQFENHFSSQVTLKENENRSFDDAFEKLKEVIESYRTL